MDEKIINEMTPYSLARKNFIILSANLEYPWTPKLDEILGLYIQDELHIVDTSEDLLEQFEYWYKLTREVHLAESPERMIELFVQAETRRYDVYPHEVLISLVNIFNGVFRHKALTILPDFDPTLYQTNT